MGPNHEHPDFPTYDRRWQELWTAMDQALAQAEHDHTDPTPVYEKYHAALLALQREYRHLFQKD